MSIDHFGVTIGNVIKVMTGDGVTSIFTKSVANGGLYQMHLDGMVNPLAASGSVYLEHLSDIVAIASVELFRQCDAVKQCHCTTSAV